MLSFVITFTYMGSPIIFRLVNGDNLATSCFEVSVINNTSLPSFTMQFSNKEWKIVAPDPLPEEMLGLESKLGGMVNAYLEGIDQCP
ncbi:MAG: hypothetical protein K0R82_851 [Flavipsychrobacter sp.]|jgi:hypothetical protein|nr:hypothetical protein [Flavipsychrobacter sp.]